MRYREPRVTMSGLIEKWLIRYPLAKPAAAPSPSGIVTPATSRVFARWMARTPESAKVAPTDRSKPPATITTVMPEAMIPLMDTCRSRLTRFPAVKKDGVVSWTIARRSVPTASASSLVLLAAGPRSRFDVMVLLNIRASSEGACLPVLTARRARGSTPAVALWAGRQIGHLRFEEHSRFHQILNHLGV